MPLRPPCALVLLPLLLLAGPLDVSAEPKRPSTRDVDDAFSELDQGLRRHLVGTVATDADEQG